MQTFLQRYRIVLKQKYFYFLPQNVWSFRNTSTVYGRILEGLEILLLSTANFLATRKYFYFLPPKNILISRPLAKRHTIDSMNKQVSETFEADEC